MSARVCLLGSATPSMESLANVRSGKYRCERLFRRVDDRKMPDIQIVDMRVEVMQRRGNSALSRALSEALLARAEAREGGRRSAILPVAEGDGEGDHATRGGGAR